MKIPGFITVWKTALTRVDKGPIIIKNFVEEEHVPRQISGLFFRQSKTNYVPPESCPRMVIDEVLDKNTKCARCGPPIDLGIDFLIRFSRSLSE